MERKAQKDIMPEKEFNQKGGKLHGFQLWVNLPKKDKMINPRYQEIPSKSILLFAYENHKVKLVPNDDFLLLATLAHYHRPQHSKYL